MARRHLVLDCPSKALAIFDPQALAHRRVAERVWMKDPLVLKAEVTQGHLALLRSEQERFTFFVEEGPAPEGAEELAAALQVPRGQLYFGDPAELPSRGWGKRRWNLWDWLFLAFLLSLVPFGMWMGGFDPQLLLILAGLGLLTVIASGLIALIFYRRGDREFAGRSGTPPLDHPERVVSVPPGTYAVRLARAEGALTIHLVQTAPSPRAAGLAAP